MNFRAQDLITFNITSNNTPGDIADDVKYLLNTYKRLTGVELRVNTDGDGNVSVRTRVLTEKPAPPLEVDLTGSRSIPPYPICEDCKQPLRFEGRLTMNHPSLRQTAALYCSNPACFKRYMLVVDPDRLSREETCAH